MNRIYEPMNLFQTTSILRRPGVVNFTYIIKIAVMFIKTILKNSKDLIELNIMY